MSDEHTSAARAALRRLRHSDGRRRDRRAQGDAARAGTELPADVEGNLEAAGRHASGGFVYGPSATRGAEAGAVVDDEDE